MSTPFSQRWVALLAAPLVAFSAVTLHQAAATTANEQVTLETAQQTRGQAGLLAQRSSGLLAQRSRIQRVRFAPGSDSATIKTSVVNGTRDLYLVGAQKGQVMSIRIVSLEDNAVFDVIAPPTGTGKRQTLKQEAFTWSSTLPSTGDYQIVVGTTRGNASYRLQVTIR